MTEKDFIMAWLLAARAGSDAPAFSDARLLHLVEQAKATYQLIQQESNNEANR
jgi:hypothetical protein